MRSKKAILNVILSLMLQVVTLICGLIVPKLIIQTFGSNVNGLISSITQFLGYITLLEAGFGPVIKATLYKAIANKDKKQIENILKASEKFFRIIALIFIIYLIILSIIYPTFVNTEFTFVYTMSLVLIISISTLAEYYFGMTYRLYLQAEQKKYITSIIQIVGYVLNTVAIVILIKLNASIHIVKLVSGLIFVLRPIVQNIYVKKKYKLNLKDADKNYDLKQKWDGLAQHIASVVHHNTDIAIITIFLGTLEVSVYSIYLLVIKGIKNLVQSLTGGIDALFGDMIAKNETQNLNKSFNIYELFYHTIVSICFCCTLILIVPFIKVYTIGIKDINYVRESFAFLIVLAEFICCIRLPYISVTYAAGHFKETKKGAWVEALSNIVISVILVWKFGIIGVAIGTLIAMALRTIEFIYHSSRFILKRSILISVKRLFLIAVQTMTCILISKLLPEITMRTYLDWFYYAIIVGLLTTSVIGISNCLIYKNEFKELINVVKNIRRGSINVNK